MDIAVEAFDLEKVARARFIGISVPMHTALRLGVHVVERIREINPNAIICPYGLYAALNAEYLLEHGTDFCIGGEFEVPLVTLVEAIDSGASWQLALPEGIIGRGAEGRPFLQRLPFTVPARDALPPLEKYARLEHNGDRRVVGYVEASRGCVHLCTHCPIPPVYSGRFFVIPRETVLEDIRRQVAAGATHITFGDPDFLNGPTHSLRIVRAMHTEFPTLTFDFTAKVEHILEHRKIFPELGVSGCLFMVSAVESLSDRVLTILEKEHTRADVVRALKIVHDAGIALRPTWVAFTPWTTLDDYIEVLEFIETHLLIDHVDPVQYAIRLLVPPGSYLLDHSAMKPHLGPLDQASFSYEWTHPDGRMDELHKTVSTLVERDVRADDDPADTFYRVWELAASLRGYSFARYRTLPPDRVRAPRLTEPWFC
jgi:radical SAM superfamily enzyme YgiQ (UPF0313 family)